MASEWVVRCVFVLQLHNVSVIFRKKCADTNDSIEWNGWKQRHEREHVERPNIFMRNCWSFSFNQPIPFTSAFRTHNRLSHSLVWYVSEWFFSFSRKRMLSFSFLFTFCSVLFLLMVIEMSLHWRHSTLIWNNVKRLQSFSIISSILELKLCETTHEYFKLIPIHWLSRKWWEQTGPNI